MPFSRLMTTTSYHTLQESISSSQFLCFRHWNIPCLSSKSIYGCHNLFSSFDSREMNMESNWARLCRTKSNKTSANSFVRDPILFFSLNHIFCAAVETNCDAKEWFFFLYVSFPFANNNIKTNLTVFYCHLLNAGSELNGSSVSVEGWGRTKENTHKRDNKRVPINTTSKTTTTTTTAQNFCKHQQLWF